MAVRALVAMWLLTIVMATGVSRAGPATDEVERLRQEVKSLKETLAAQQKQIAELREVKRLQEELLARNRKLAQQEQQLQELRQRVTAAEVQSATLKRRNEQLLAELEQTVREIRKLKEGKAAEPPARNVPAQPVEGLVKTVDRSGLVKINIGLDAGLQRGQTLEVFRLGADPKESRYLGSIRIVEVTAKEAVAQPVGKVVTGIQAGDRVASRIIESAGRK